MASEKSNSVFDLGVKFNVSGGTNVNGETGKILKSQLTQLVEDLNIPIKFSETNTKKELNSLLDSIRSSIKPVVVPFMWQAMNQPSDSVGSQKSKANAGTMSASNIAAINESALASAQAALEQSFSSAGEQLSNVGDNLSNEVERFGQNVSNALSAFPFRQIASSSEDAFKSNGKKALKADVDKEVAGRSVIGTNIAKITTILEKIKESVVSSKGKKSDAKDESNITELLKQIRDAAKATGKKTKSDTSESKEPQVSKSDAAEEKTKRTRKKNVESTDVAVENQSTKSSGDASVSTNGVGEDFKNSINALFKELVDGYKNSIKIANTTLVDASELFKSISGGSTANTDAPDIVETPSKRKRKANSSDSENITSVSGISSESVSQLLSAFEKGFSDIVRKTIEAIEKACNNITLSEEHPPYGISDEQIETLRNAISTSLKKDFQNQLIAALRSSFDNLAQSFSDTLSKVQIAPPTLESVHIDTDSLGWLTETIQNAFQNSMNSIDMLQADKFNNAAKIISESADRYFEYDHDYRAFANAISDSMSDATLYVDKISSVANSLKAITDEVMSTVTGIKDNIEKTIALSSGSNVTLQSGYSEQDLSKISESIGQTFSRGVGSQIQEVIEELETEIHHLGNSFKNTESISSTQPISQETIEAIENAATNLENTTKILYDIQEKFSALVQSTYTVGANSIDTNTKTSAILDSAIEILNKASEQISQLPQILSRINVTASFNPDGINEVINGLKDSLEKQEKKSSSEQKQEGKQRSSKQIKEEYRRTRIDNMQEYFDKMLLAATMQEGSEARQIIEKQAMSAKNRSIGAISNYNKAYANQPKLLEMKGVVDKEIQDMKTVFEARMQQLGQNAAPQLDATEQVDRIVNAINQNNIVSDIQNVLDALSQLQQQITSVPSATKNVTPITDEQAYLKEMKDYYTINNNLKSLDPQSNKYYKQKAERDAALKRAESYDDTIKTSMQSAVSDFAASLNEPAVTFAKAESAYAEVKDAIKKLYDEKVAVNKGASQYTTQEEVERALRPAIERAYAKVYSQGLQFSRLDKETNDFEKSQKYLYNSEAYQDGEKKEKTQRQNELLEFTKAAQEYFSTIHRVAEMERALEVDKKNLSTQEFEQRKNQIDELKTRINNSFVDINGNQRDSLKSVYEDKRNSYINNTNYDSFDSEKQISSAEKPYESAALYAQVQLAVEKLYAAKSRLVEITQALNNAETTVDKEQLRQEYSAVAQIINQQTNEMARLKAEIPLDNAFNKDMDEVIKAEIQQRNNALKVLETQLKLSQDIKNWQEKNTEAAKEYANALSEIEDSAKSATTLDEFRDLKAQFNSIKAQAQAEGLTGRKLTETEIAANIAAAKTLMQKYNELMSKAGSKAFSGDYNDQIKTVVSAINNAIEKGTTRSLKNARTQLSSLTSEFKSAGIAGANVFTALGKKIKGLAQVFISGTIVSEIKNSFTDAARSITNLDSAFTNIAMTMPLTTENMNRLKDSSIALSKQLGVSLDQVLNAAEIYANANITVDEIIARSTPTALLASASGMSTSATADLIQGALYQFELEDTTENLMKIVDVVESISASTGVEFKRSIEQISEAIQTSGAIAHSSGYSIEEYAATIGALVEKTRKSGSEVANALKMIFARMGQNLEGEATEEEISKAEKAYRSLGIELRSDTNTFRDIPDVLTELSQKWATLTDTEKSYIAEISAGNRNRSVFLSLMDSYATQLGLVETAENSAGFATEANEERLDSYEAKMRQFTAASQGLWNNLLDTEILKFGLDIATKLVDITDKLLNSWFGKTVVVPAGLFLIIQSLPNFLIELRESDSLIGHIVKALTSSEDNVFKKSWDSAKNLLKTLQDTKKLKNDLKALSSTDSSTNTATNLAKIFSRNSHSLEEMSQMASRVGFSSEQVESARAIAQCMQQLSEQNISPTTEGGLDSLREFIESNSENVDDIVEAASALGFQRDELDALAQSTTINAAAQATSAAATQSSTTANNANAVSAANSATQTNVSTTANNNHSTSVNANTNQINANTDALNRNADAASRNASVSNGAAGVGVVAEGAAVLGTVSKVVGVIGIVVSAITTIWGIIDSVKSKREQEEKAIEETRKKATELADQMDESRRKADEQSESFEKLAKKYVNLSKGVNELGYNVSLSTDSYKEYKEIVNQIAEMNPSIVDSYNSQGVAILNLGDDIEATTEKYRQMNREAARATYNDSIDTILQANKEYAENRGKVLGVDNPESYFKNLKWWGWSPVGMAIDLMTKDKSKQSYNDDMAVYETFISELKKNKGKNGFYLNLSDNPELNKYIEQDHLFGNTITSVNGELKDFLKKYGGKVKYDSYGNALDLTFEQPLSESVIDELEREYEKKKEENRANAKNMVSALTNKAISDEDSFQKLDAERQSFVESVFNNLIEYGSETLEQIGDDKIKLNDYYYEVIRLAEDNAFMDFENQKNEFSKLFNEGKITPKEYYDKMTEIHDAVSEYLANNPYKETIVVGYDVQDDSESYYDKTKTVFERLKVGSQDVQDYIYSLSESDLDLLLELPIELYVSKDALETALNDYKEQLTKANLGHWWDITHKEDTKALTSMLSDIGNSYRKALRENLTSDELRNIMSEYNTFDWEKYGITGESGVGRISDALEDLMITKFKKYMESAKDLSEDEKTFLGNLLSAALSTSEQIESVADGLSKLKNIQDTFKEINKEVAKYGRIGYENISKLIEEHPELNDDAMMYLSGKINANTFLNAAKKAYAVDVSNYEQSLVEKAALNENYYKMLGGLDESVIKFMSDNYGVDLSNCSDYLKSKLAIYEKFAAANTVFRDYVDQYTGVFDIEKLLNDKKNDYKLVAHVDAIYQEYKQALEDLLILLTPEWDFTEPSEEVEKFNQVLEDMLSLYDQMFDGIESVADAEIERLEKEKELLEDKNEETKKEIELIKLRKQLDDAKNNKTIREYHADVGGFVWAADQAAIAEAEEKLRDAESEAQTDAIDTQIKQLEEYKKQFSDMSEDINDNQNIGVALQLLGKKDVNELLSLTEDEIKSLSDKYESLYLANEKESGKDKLETYTALTDEQIASMYGSNFGITMQNLIDNVKGIYYVPDALKDFAAAEKKLASQITTSTSTNSNNDNTKYINIEKLVIQTASDNLEDILNDAERYVLVD